jgi:hypothetical protein
MPQVDFTSDCSRVPDAWQQYRKRSLYNWGSSRPHGRRSVEHRGDLAQTEERWSKEVKTQYDFERRVRDILAGSWQQDNLEDSLEKAFHESVDRWKADTLHWSSITKMVAHPSYLRIIGLASYGRNAVLRLLIAELQNDPDHWFAALEAITGKNPVPPTVSLGEAVASWIEWWNQRTDDARSKVTFQSWRTRSTQLPAQ